MRKITKELMTNFNFLLVIILAILIEFARRKESFINLILWILEWMQKM